MKTIVAALLIVAGFVTVASVAPAATCEVTKKTSVETDKDGNTVIKIHTITVCGK